MTSVGVKVVHLDTIWAFDLTVLPLLLVIEPWQDPLRLGDNAPTSGDIAQALLDWI